MSLLSFYPHSPLSAFSTLRRPSTTTTTDHSLSLSSHYSSIHFASPVPRVQILYHAPYVSPYSCRVAGPTAGGGAWLHDAGATAAVLAGAYALVFTFDNLTQQKIIQQGRINNHVGNHCNEFKQKTGPYFVRVAFHGFLANFQARYFASLVPLVNCLRLLIHGLSLATDEGLIKSVTREGKPEELLRGPLYYVLILILCALTFWRESPIGIISLAMMCGGDGIADVMGRRFGSLKIPYNQQKSWAGSISMFVFGFLISIGVLYYYSVLGYFQLDWVQTMQRVALVSLVATVVESLPTTKVVDDNISVPLASMVAAYLTFGY